MQSKNPAIRRCIRVLAMVHELHKVGFQRLRIAPGMSASGGHWRCEFLASKYTHPYHGARTSDGYFRSARHGSGLDKHYFEWKDAQTDTARQLADKFIVRFPEIIQESCGRDWAYVGWYTEMLGVVEKYGLSFAYADYDLRGGYGCLNTNGSEIKIIPPAPLALEHKSEI